jgi:hypothetical protein
VLLAGLIELNYLWLPAVVVLVASVLLVVLAHRNGKRLAWKWIWVVSVAMAAVLFRSLLRQLFRATDFWVGPLTAPGLIFAELVFCGCFVLWSVSVSWCLARTATSSLDRTSRVLSGIGLALLVAAPVPSLLTNARLMAVRAGAVGEARLHRYFERAVAERDAARIKAIADSPKADVGLLGQVIDLGWRELHERRAGWSDLLLGDFRSVGMIVAARASDDPKLLRVLAGSRERAVLYQVSLAPSAAPSVQLLVAENPAAPDELLCRLVQESDERVGNAAWQALAGRGPLTRLAWSPDPVVRKVFGAYPDAPRRVLQHLARDPIPEVRCAVAENPRAGEGVLDLLSKDSDERVRRCVARRLEAGPSTGSANERNGK